MKIASAAYPIDWLASPEALRKKLARWVAQAAQAGADLLVFPEYGGMEWASLAGEAVRGDQAACTDAAAAQWDLADGILAALAADHGVHILGPSAPVDGGNGTHINRAGFYRPDGARAHADKQIMTQYERDSWSLRAGDGPALVETPFGRIGILICYDSEFPLLARALAEAGAEILLVPSCTDALMGYHRVRVGCMARALENQMVVVHSVTVGPVDWCPAVDENHGAAALYGPPDHGFPPDGVLMQGPMDTPGWTIAEVDIEAVRRVRREGQVRNLTHWPEQAARIPHVTFLQFGEATP
ncbi:carbon-nitrogen hydrolase family protein [Pseudoruegeria sp. SHC-113]|uniref:carbon-nitrogen hydrolase family protein n=1 Tax=Pseudoruegeria sp. SHC-113 TaxID=2855439 RepID=UPI0021BBAD9A|nr:carbon-nitrogen hydrolase family protein [Pseudoruegeria sp. SHC-113]MCT8161692.1 carbon-nitrogen hydrolase family protein [Pseudoruegeria sp. SHC-113]